MDEAVGVVEIADLLALYLPPPRDELKDYEKELKELFRKALRDGGLSDEELERVDTLISRVFMAYVNGAEIDDDLMKLHTAYYRRFVARAAEETLGKEFNANSEELLRMLYEVIAEENKRSREHVERYMW